MSFLIKDILNKPCVSSINTNRMPLNYSLNSQQLPVVNNNSLKKPLAINLNAHYFNYVNSVYNNFVFNLKPEEPEYCNNFCREDIYRRSIYGSHIPSNNSSSMFFDYTNKIRNGGQPRFTSNQIEALEKWFTIHKYLSPDMRKQLAEMLHLTDRQVKTWFQNRRAKWKKKISLQCAK